MGLFKLGIPTAIDVKKIRDAYPDINLKPGDEIPYRKICELIGITSHKESRFKSVTYAWRMHVQKESGLLFKAEGGEKFIVMSNAQKAQHSVNQTRYAGNYIRKSIITGKLVDTKQLSENELRAFEFAQRNNASFIALQSLKQQPALPTI